MQSNTAQIYEDYLFQQESDIFLSEQIITYLGNKRSLIPFIQKAVTFVKHRLNQEKLSILDLFSGSGVVSRALKQHASNLIVNDLEDYSTILNQCYLSTPSKDLLNKLDLHYLSFEQEVKARWSPGFITDLYAPQDDTNILSGERAFYTHRNAIYLDTARQIIADMDSDIQHYFLAPLLYTASVHNNTSGVFKGFYKDASGIGCFGGNGKNALKRICKDIVLPFPVFSNFSCDCQIKQQDANAVVREISEIDLAYFDPPYNQHPYGSNYFMLNLIARNTPPDEISPISGIPKAWNRSAYNKKQLASTSLFDAISTCPAKYILLSYNSEGHIPYDEIKNFLKTQGNLQTQSIDYNTFRGCRNLNSRSLKVTEFLFLLEK